MTLEHLLNVELLELDGTPVMVRDLVTGPAVIFLVDPRRMRPERRAAEIAWVRERLQAGVALVLVWPRQPVAGAFDPGGPVARHLVDARGAFQRAVSPAGRRIAVLVDPERGTAEILTAMSAVFNPGNGTQPGDGRGTDRTIDLGDLQQ